LGDFRAIFLPIIRSLCIALALSLACPMAADKTLKLKVKSKSDECHIEVLTNKKGTFNILTFPLKSSSYEKATLASSNHLLVP
jgi:hypothetical protein